jgi:serine phosphatase RsbU (regulator of sigma subunit)/HAMP domain-containing protein
MDWIKKSIKNKILAVGLGGLLSVALFNLFLLLLPMRGTVNDFLKKTQDSIADLKKFNNSIEDIKKSMTQTVNKIADDNATVLLGDVKKNLAIQSNIYSKQVSQALDQFSDYLIEDQGKSLLTSTDLTRILVKAARGDLEVIRDEKGKAGVKYDTNYFKKFAKDLNGYSGVRQVTRDGTAYLEGVTQIPGHGVTVVLLLDITKTINEIETKKQVILKEMMTSFQKGVGPLFEKVNSLADQSVGLGSRVATRMNRIIGIIAVFNIVFIIAGAWASLYFARQIVSPLLDLVKAAGEIATGNFNVNLNVKTGDEVELLSNSFGKMTDSLKHSYENQRKLNSFTRNVTIQEEEQSILQEVHQAFKDILGFADIALIDFSKPLAHGTKLPPFLVLTREPETERLILVPLEECPEDSLWRRSKENFLALGDAAIVQSGVIVSRMEDFGSMQVGVMVAKDSGKPSLGLFALAAKDVQWTQFLCNLFESITISTALSLQRLTSEALKKEVGLAQTVQGLLMHKPSISDRCTIDIGYHQASQGGGDWFFYEEVGDYLVFIIADVTGHGVPAALLTAFGRGCASAMTNFFKAQDPTTTTLDPSLYLRYIDGIIFGSTKGKIGMTAFAVIVNLNTGEATFSNGGHNFPYQICYAEQSIQADNETADVKKPVVSIKSLMQRSNRIGYHDNSEFQTKKATFKPGDRIFLYTDGLVECKNPAAQDYGEVRLKKLITNAGPLSGEEFLATVENDVFKFANGEPLHDDVMLIIIELTPDKNKKKLAEVA